MPGAVPVRQVFPRARELLETLEREERLPPGALDSAVLDQLASLTVARQVPRPDPALERV